MIPVGARVKIIPLELCEGRVTAIWISYKGVQYDVRYFQHGKAEQVYFFEDELNPFEDRRAIL